MPRRLTEQCVHHVCSEKDKGLPHRETSLVSFGPHHAHDSVWSAETGSFARLPFGSFVCRIETLKHDQIRGIFTKSGYASCAAVWRVLQIRKAGASMESGLTEEGVSLALGTLL
jgi:hypothetical protein